MSKKSAGFLRGKTRVMARHRKPSKLRVRDRIKSFNIGDSVVVLQNSDMGNAPHMRYRGKTGKVMEKRGDAYIIRLHMLDSWKTLIIPAVHLQKAG